MTLPSGGAALHVERLNRRGGRHAVQRHVHDGRDAARSGRARGVHKSFPVGAAGLIDVDVGIDQKGSGEFGKIIGSREFDMTISGYTVGSDATDAVKQYYDSKVNENGLGDKELDAEIAKLSSIEDEDVLRFDHDGRTFAIVRIGDDAYALDGLCTHEAAHLAGGMVMDYVIECPMHNGRFDVRNGRVRNAPSGRFSRPTRPLRP